MILPRRFYLDGDVTELARRTLGKVLVTRFEGAITSGIITETEAYAGVTDRASHAFGGRRTNRTEIMYRIGGTAYIYLCYGIHSLFNIVTNHEDIPHAILIRGIIPLDGKKIMASRTRGGKISENSGNGPGKLAVLLGIHYQHSGIDLTGGAGAEEDAIWIEDRGFIIEDQEILTSTRIGVGYAGDDALLPWRFHINPAALKKK